MIPVQNGAAFLSGAIASALNQEEQDAEIVVVDNVSTDNTPDIVQSFKDPRLRYLRGRELGMADNWNRCIELAAGEFITLLHHDDRWLPGFLRRALRLTDRYPEADVVYSACRIVDAAGRFLRLHRPFPEPHVWSGECELEVLIRGNYIYCPTVVYRSSTLRKVGGFTSGLELTPDWEALMRLALAGSVFIYDPEPLSEYCERGDSLHAALEGNLRTGEQHIVALLNIAGQLKQVGSKVRSAHAETLAAWGRWEIAVALKEFKNLQLAQAAHHFGLACRTSSCLLLFLRQAYLDLRKRARLKHDIDDK
jgi:glycosyltransferase involved in cell wall biosynthesis